MESEHQSSASERFDSWKAIANYLGKTVRTVQRWEQVEGLPVRRIQHQGGSSVYAYKHELDRWLTRRNLVVHESAPPHQAPASGSTAGATTPGSGISHTEPRVVALPASPPERSPEPGRAGHAQTARRWLPALVVALGVGAVWWWTARDAAPGVRGLDTPLSPRLLTTNPGQERFPTLSPDGRQVAYTWAGPDGQPDLYLRLVDGNEHLRLTHDAAIEEAPGWSPDGLSLAFLRHSGPGRRTLTIIPAIGGAERPMLEFSVPQSLDVARSMAAGLEWSPDGRHIVITEGEPGSDAMRLTRYTPANGERVPLTEFVEGVEDHAPAWSPDGRRLAFTRSNAALMGTIHVLELTADIEAAGTPLALPKANDWDSEPEWSIDGRELVFSSGRWPNTRLWRVPADGHDAPAPLTGPGPGASQPSIVPVTGPGGTGPDWRLVYRVINLDNDIWRIDLTGDTADTPLLASSQRERFPAYSHDGRVAFLSDRSGDREIWVSRTDSEELQQWTQWRSSYIWRPAFSPDGRQLAYTVEIDGVLQVHVQDRALGPARSLHGGGGADLDLAWSRDGDTLYVQSRASELMPAGIYATDVASGEAGLRVEGNYQPLGEGPMGRVLYCVGAPEGKNLLFAFDLGAAELKSIELQGQDFHSFTRGPDGIYFVAGEDGGFGIHRWNWSTGQQDRLRTLDHTPEIGMAISPDGGEALLARIVLRRSDLMIADSAPEATP